MTAMHTEPCAGTTCHWRVGSLTVQCGNSAVLKQALASPAQTGLLLPALLLRQGLLLPAGLAQLQICRCKMQRMGQQQQQQQQRLSRLLLLLPLRGPPTSCS